MGGFLGSHGYIPLTHRLYPALPLGPLSQGSEGMSTVGSHSRGRAQ